MRLDGKVLNPEAAAEIPVYSETGEPVDAEVDVRVEVVGYWGVYRDEYVQLHKRQEDQGSCSLRLPGFFIWVRQAWHTRI